jgi:universal stress protein A
MFPLKKILCPVDFSLPSYDGVKAAVELAQRFSAELILVNVIQPVQPAVAAGVPTTQTGRKYYLEIEDAARKSFEELIRSAIPEDVQVSTKILRGQPADEIIRECENENATAIVIATHGWTGWRRFVFGSVAEKVVRLARVPVVTIPAPKQE